MTAKELAVDWEEGGEGGVAGQGQVTDLHTRLILSPRWEEEEEEACLVDNVRHGLESRARNLRVEEEEEEGGES